MRAGLGVGLTMLAISAAVAACEHEAQRDTTANATRAYFESAAERASPVSRDRAMPAAARADDDEARAGHTDKFLWDDRAASGTPDAGPDSGPGDDL